uniref:EF-hand domain-containing protein n=1 Tax=Picocystis salinarum TaxID=88271 RepID=A0A7S3UDH3_9CHLO
MDVAHRSDMRGRTSHGSWKERALAKTKRRGDPKQEGGLGDGKQDVRDDARTSSTTADSEDLEDTDVASDDGDSYHDEAKIEEEGELERAVALSLSQPVEGMDEQHGRDDDASPSTKRGKKRKGKRTKIRRYKPSIPLSEDTMQHTFSTLTEGKGHFDALDVQRMALELGVSLETEVAYDMIALCASGASEQVDWARFRFFLAQLYDVDPPRPS